MKMPYFLFAISIYCSDILNHMVDYNVIPNLANYLWYYTAAHSCVGTTVLWYIGPVNA